MAANTTQPTLTFGIELEFLCLRPEDLTFDKITGNPFCDRLDDAIYEALSHHGVKAYDNSLDIDVGDPVPPYSRWRIDEDVLELSPEEQLLLPPGYVVEPIELASRKFYYGCEDWRSEIIAVLNALKELQGTGLRFLTNASTGFHVHVGYNEHFVPLRTAKNIFQFATAFESVIDELHTAPRVDIPWILDNRHHCYPPSFFHTKRGHGVDLFERLQFIERATTLEQLGSAFFVSADEMGSYECLTGHNSAYNFDNLYPDEDLARPAATLTGTIEFRQHAGTLDYEPVVAWIEFTTALVRYAAEAGESMDGIEDFLQILLIATDGKSSEHGFATICEMLELPEEVGLYYEALMDGTLRTPPLDMNDSHAPLIPLISSNWAGNAQRSARSAVKGAIREKFDTGCYGHDAAVAPFEVSEQTLQEIVWVKKAELWEQGVEFRGEESVKLVLESVLGQLSMMHQAAAARAAVDRACGRVV